MQGIFLANLLEGMYDVEEGVVMGIVLLSAGLGFLVYFAVVNSKIKKRIRFTKISAIKLKLIMKTKTLLIIAGLFFLSFNGCGFWEKNIQKQNPPNTESAQLIKRKFILKM